MCLHYLNLCTMQAMVPITASSSSLPQRGAPPAIMGGVGQASMTRPGYGLSTIGLPAAPATPQMMVQQM